MNLDCPKCHERFYADGEEGQENCPNCGTRVKSDTAPCKDQKGRTRMKVQITRHEVALGMALLATVLITIFGA